MNTALARFLSFILHPLLIPTFLFGIIFYGAPLAVYNLQAFNEQQSIDFFGLKFSFKAGLLLLVFFFTFLIPSYLLYVLYRLKIIKSLTMENLQDRRLPYLLIVILYTVFSYASFRYMKLLPEMTVIMASITFSISCVAFISLYWQISAHATGMGGVIGALLTLTLKMHLDTLLIPVLAVIILAGFLMSARLYLNAHTPRQIMVGLVLGVVVCSTTLFVFI